MYIHQNRLAPIARLFWSATLQVVKLIAAAKLLPDDAQRVALLATMERCNAACDWLAGEAFAAQTADKYRLHGDHYRTLREKFSLSAQMAVRVIAKVCDAYKRDKSKRPTFDPHGAVPYDQRILSFKAMDRVSILTLDGRTLIPYVAGDYHRARLDGVRGQSDLVLRDGQWYLFVTVDVPDGAPVTPTGTLGVDLGIRNLATDSDGERHSGAVIEVVRQRFAKHKASLQKCGTKSAKRRLKKIAGKEARFRSDVNHTIAKHIVAKAQGTGRQIALENLKGIRDRITVRHTQRSTHHGWAFFQMRAFIEYKARLAGVPVVAVDPRNTSRTCPQCGHCDKANRKSQSEFVCKSCGFAGHADVVGAVNIARRAPVNAPIVADVEA